MLSRHSQNRPAFPPTTQAVNEIRKLISELECPEEEDMQKMVRRFIAEKLIGIFNDGDSNEV